MYVLNFNSLRYLSELYMRLKMIAYVFASSPKPKTQITIQQCTDEHKRIHATQTVIRKCYKQHAKPICRPNNYMIRVMQFPFNAVFTTYHGVAD